MCEHNTMDNTHIERTQRTKIQLTQNEIIVIRNSINDIIRRHHTRIFVVIFLSPSFFQQNYKVQLTYVKFY